jgi:hypothetical protein
MKPARCYRLCAALLLVVLLAGCSNEEAFNAADHSKCRELGYEPGSGDYEVCVSEVRRQRTALAAPELRE